MKKVLAIIILATLLACCATAVAFGQTTEEYVKELATQHDKVLAAECVIYKRACVIALKTEKFTTKSEYDEYVDGLAEKIKTDCEVDYVYVSRSPKLMLKLVELSKMSEDERDKAIEDLIKKQIERRDPVKTPRPPRCLGIA